MDTVDSRVLHRHAARHRPDRKPQVEPGKEEPQPPRKVKKGRIAAWSAVVAAVLVAAAIAFIGREKWIPIVGSAVAAFGGPASTGLDHATGCTHDHEGEASHRHEGTPVTGHEGRASHANKTEAGHDHASGDRPVDDEADVLELSEKGRKNIGLTLAKIRLRDFQKTISVPAIVVESPARTEIAVSAPMTGIVTRIYPIRGEAVRPGQPLFDLRLTHEGLIQKQSDLLRELEQLDVVKREAARLDEVTSSGAVAGKRLLEQQYEQRKLEAAIRAGKQGLILYGLTQEQVDDIATTRRLLQDLTLAAPQPAESDYEHDHEAFLQVAALAVSTGEQVPVGTRLATLTDHCELYLEGRAFEQDAQALNEAANRGVAVSGVVDENGTGTQEIAGLRILYVDNTVDPDSRALKFYVRLHNELVRNEVTAEGHRFIGWRYRPGQRVQLHVPVETWQDRVVLPVAAAVQEGPEWFVFRQEGRRFRRTPVHVEYHDQRWVVVENDGALSPGDLVAASGAYQMHLALKNKAGAGVDPHAGHNH